MKLEEITLEHFQDYIFKNLEKEINFQLPTEINTLSKDEFLNERFELTKTELKQYVYHTVLTFRIYISLEDIEEINLLMLKSLFDGFIEKYNIKTKNIFIDLGFYCCNERQFELELMIYTEK